MATNTETLSALLSELETERLDLLREDPYGHRLQVISGLIYRTKVALLRIYWRSKTQTMKLPFYVAAAILVLALFLAVAGILFAASTEVRIGATILALMTLVALLLAWQVHQNRNS